MKNFGPKYCENQQMGNNKMCFTNKQKTLRCNNRRNTCPNKIDFFERYQIENKNSRNLN